MTRNLTVGPPTRLIVLFTLPLLLGNAFQQVYSFTDAAVVGRLIGLDALAAVGATGSLVFFLVGFTWGACNGLAIPTARAFGAGDMAGVRRSVAAGTVISVALAVVITLVGVGSARALLRLLDTPSELLPDSTTFLVVTFLGTGATVAFNYLSAIIRALGDSRTPLVFLVVSSVLNAGLVVLFVGSVHMGVGGAAFATVVAQLVSVGLCLWLVAARMPELHVRREDWRLTRRDFVEPSRMGLPMGFQMSVIALGTLVLQYSVNRLGADAVAAFTAGVRIDQLAVTPLTSFGVAIATFCAQNRGARQWRRIREGVFRTTMLSLVAALVVGAAIVVFAVPMIRLFVGQGQDEVVALAHRYLVFNGSLYMLLGSMFVLRNTLQGLGQAAVPTLGGVGELVFRVVAGLVLVPHVGFWGVCLAGPLAWFGAWAPMAVAWVHRRRRLIEEERLAAVDAAARGETGGLVGADGGAGVLAGAEADGLVGHGAGTDAGDLVGHDEPATARPLVGHLAGS